MCPIDGPNTTDMELFLYYSHLIGQRALLMDGDNLARTAKIGMECVTKVTRNGLVKRPKAAIWRWNL